MSTITTLLGKRLREFRLARGLSQEKLAELAHLHPTYVGQVERGEKNVTVDTLNHFCEALEVTFSELFEGIGSRFDREHSYALRCYELIAALERRKQAQILDILTSLLEL